MVWPDKKIITKIEPAPSSVMARVLCRMQKERKNEAHGPENTENIH